VGLLIALLVLPGLAAGYVLITRQPWARIVAIVVTLLGLLNLGLLNSPIGSATGL
jgi:hypothetical protein